MNLINATAQYNIGDFYLDGGTAFLRVLEKCPLLVEVFDKMLSKRLISMYGNDPRAPAVEEVRMVKLNHVICILVHISFVYTCDNA